MPKCLGIYSYMQHSVHLSNDPFVVKFCLSGILEWPKRTTIMCPRVERACILTPLTADRMPTSLEKPPLPIQQVFLALFSPFICPWITNGTQRLISGVICVLFKLTLSHRSRARRSQTASAAGGRSIIKQKTVRLASHFPLARTPWVKTRP